MRAEGPSSAQLWHTVEAQSEAIYCYFRRLGVDAIGAEDLTQEALLTAWQALGRLRHSGKIRSWLYGIAYRVYLKRRETARKEGSEFPIEEVAGPDGDPGDDRHLASRAVRDAVQRLPDTYRHPLLLVYWEELSYLEAARALSLPLGTLAWRVHTGLKLLREALSEKGLANVSAEKDAGVADQVSET
ncbi:MAG: RNA polymerase sigma factor [Armatimonadota bacterium]|jgi:RNA polymerase sigma-70 factor (ECF subfamily)